MRQESHAESKQRHLASVVDLISKKRSASAAELLHTLLAKSPNDHDFLYHLAICQRQQGELSQALDTLARLESLKPKFAAVFLERGRTLVALGRQDDALVAFEKCVRLNPTFLGGWAGMLELAATLGKNDLRNRAIQQLRYFESMDHELVLVLRTFHDGETFKAERLCRHYLRKHPKNVEAMCLLARIGSEFGILDDAEFILESACEFEPSNTRARLQYIDVLHKRQNYSRALEHANTLIRLQPSDQVFRLAYANQVLATGDVDGALKVYDEILSKPEDNPLVSPRLFVTRGHAFKTIGRIKQAIQDYRAAYAMQPDFGDSYWSLANLKTYSFTQEELSQMHGLVDSPSTSVEDKIHMFFALGKAYEDLEDFAFAFSFYKQGNQLNKQRLRYDAHEMSKRLLAQEEVCTKEFFAKRSGFGCNDPDPIFIVGLPRSGSTLLEQILASHSLVEGTLELHHISGYAQKMDGRRRRTDPLRYPYVLRELRADLAKELGQRFIGETRVHRTTKPFFIDKMPNNFRHIGMISLILPNAKIIDARRNPMSCCFSCYKQLFASGQEFTYGQEEIATYYNDYCRLMDHWSSVLPGKVLTVHYEDVVGDLERQVRRILDHCGLPFDEACLTFHETKRSIRTPSAEQVRQPIYRDGLEQWRNFEPWLEPMKVTLGQTLDRYPVSTGTD
ncbi:MAG: sulfotransferase [Gammaproteobacteria bacterium]|nr:sulfotransferase [Gammaproteobacteria bacterium]